MHEAAYYRSKCPTCFGAVRFNPARGARGMMECEGKACDNAFLVCGKPMVQRDGKDYRCDFNPGHEGPCWNADLGSTPLEAYAGTLEMTEAVGKLTFAVGDVVALRSGSPHMTVCRVDTDGSVDVHWFHEDRLCRADRMPAACFHTYLTAPTDPVVE